MKKWLKIPVLTTFILYSFIVLHIVFFSRSYVLHSGAWLEIWKNGRLGYGINLIPFRTISGYLKNISQGTIVKIAVRNLAGNLLMFLPLGIYLPIIWERCRNLKSTFLISLAVLIGIEVIQFITLLGSLDIDDLILNLCGVLIGYCLWKWLKIVRRFNL